jgi:hypothetical protein
MSRSPHLADPYKFKDLFFFVFFVFFPIRSDYTANMSTDLQLSAHEEHLVQLGRM